MERSEEAIARLTWVVTLTRRLLYGVMLLLVVILAILQAAESADAKVGDKALLFVFGLVVCVVVGWGWMIAVDRGIVREWMPHLENIGFGVKDTEVIAEVLGVAVWRIERYWSESSSDMEEVD